MRKKRGAPIADLPPASIAAALDAIDRRILDILQTDAGIANAALADRVGLSPPACLGRVRRLKELKIIRRQVALLDAAAVGLPVLVWVGVSLRRKTDDAIALFRRAVLAEPAVTSCAVLAGEIDFLLSVRAATLQDYHALAQRLFSEENGVGGYTSHVAIEEVKELAPLPLPGGRKEA